MSRKYISAVDTAKLIRQALKEAFPAVKFSVRSSSYAGGASINVSWIDGPTAKQVEAITGVFSGAYFDGSIDYKGAVYAMLDGELVRFGADFIFCNRENSDRAVESAIGRVYRKYENNFKASAVARPTVTDYRRGALYNVSLGFADHYGLQGLIAESLARNTYAIGKASKTAGRAFVTHDDGYSRSVGCGMSSV